MTRSTGMKNRVIWYIITYGKPGGKRRNHFGYFGAKNTRQSGKRFPHQQKKQESQESISFRRWSTSRCQFLDLLAKKWQNRVWHLFGSFSEKCLGVQQKGSKSQESISFRRWSTSRCRFLDLLAKKWQNRVWHLFGSFRDRGLNGRNRRVSRVKFDQGAILRRPFEFCWRFSSRIAEKAIFWKSSFGTEVVRFGGKRSRIGLEFAPEACFCPRINLASSDFGFLN